MATITIAVASLGLSGAFTYQAANATTAGSVGTAAAPAALLPHPNAEGDDGFTPTGAVPPRSASAGQPVAVSGGS